MMSKKGIRLFCPSPFEIPSGYSSKTTVFGMGKSRAENLARRLNDEKPIDWIIVYGSAGALQRHLRIGSVYAASEILSTTNQAVRLPALELPLSTAKLLTSPSVLSTPLEKQDFGKKTSADLVDCESGFIWHNLNEDVRPNILFIRGIIDDDSTDISFLFRKNFLSNLNPQVWPKHFRMFRSWISYRQGMRAALTQIENHLTYSDDSDLRHRTKPL